MPSGVGFIAATSMNCAGKVIVPAARLIQRIGDEWAKENPELCVEAPIAQGVLALADSSVNVRLVGKVKAAEHWPVEREWLKRIKAAFDAEGIEIPFPRNVTYLRREDDDAAAS